MAAKRIAIQYQTGAVIYVIVHRVADGYFLDDADGSFAAAPADRYLALAEDALLPGLFSVSESRTVWNDGDYEISFFQQAGGAPASTDLAVGAGTMAVLADEEADEFQIANMTFNNTKGIVEIRRIVRFLKTSIGDILGFLQRLISTGKNTDLSLRRRGG